MTELAQPGASMALCTVKARDGVSDMVPRTRFRMGA
jgi:hypothetical protein